MDERGVDAVAFPAYTALPGKIASKTQPFCENNRLASITGLPSVVVPLEGFAAIEILGRANSECDIIAIAKSMSID